MRQEKGAASTTPSAARLKPLEQRLGYEFRDAELLATALRHRSYTKAQIAKIQAAKAKDAESDLPPSFEDYERLEFLGDSVLSLAISTYLMQREEAFGEGMLSRIRASLVNERTLAGLARDLGLPEWLSLGAAEEKSGGREKNSILADCLEAVFGAAYLDGGTESALPLILRIYAPVLQENLLNRVESDYKTLLQESTQEIFKTTPTYRLLQAEGPDHRKVFSVALTIPGHSEFTGKGSSIKEASQKAAKGAYEYLQRETPAPKGGKVNDHD